VGGESGTFAWGAVIYFIVILKAVKEAHFQHFAQGDKDPRYATFLIQLEILTHESVTCGEENLQFILQIRCMPEWGTKN